MNFGLNVVTRTVARQVLVAKKNSPAIFFSAGVVGVVASTVLACRATLQLEDTLDSIKSDLDRAKGTNELRHFEDDNADENIYHKELTLAYSKGVLQITRLYAPAIVVGGLSIGALTGSHIALTRRNAVITAAYAAISKSFDEYRIRVRNHLGEEQERDIYHAVELREIEVEGKKSKDMVADPNRWSTYAKWFDEANPNWQKNSELNRLFVQCQQNYLNQLLQARGHVFLNEAYDQLGIDRTQAGQVVGWVTGGEGDGYIDFGIFEAYSSEFVNGWERNIILDFNVDGAIYDKI